MKPSTAMGALSLFFTLLLLFDKSEQQYAWRPQGRFGKRMGVEGAQMPTEEGSTLTGGLGQLAAFRSGLQYLDSPVFRANGVVCLAAGSRGNYKCFTFQGNDLPTDTDKQ